MGLLGLFGGYGEFDDWAGHVHRRLIDAGTGDGSVRILPMSYAIESVNEIDLPLYRELKVPTEIVPVSSRQDAERDENGDALATASLIFLHGGWPAWMSEVLSDTPVWLAVLNALSRGASLAATSGGIMCLGGTVPSFEESTGRVSWVPGLGLFPEAAIGSHWASEVHEGIHRPYQELEGRLILAVEERAVAVGDGAQWSVFGEGDVHIIHSGREDVIPPGQSFELDLGKNIGT